jgi:acyl carrier protein
MRKQKGAIAMPTTQVTNESVEKVVFDGLAELGADREQISREATFEALDVDSLDLVELAQIVEDEFGVALGADDVKGLKTVGDAVDLIVAKAG